MLQTLRFPLLAIVILIVILWHYWQNISLEKQQKSEPEITLAESAIDAHSLQIFELPSPPKTPASVEPTPVQTPVKEQQPVAVINKEVKLNKQKQSDDITGKSTKPSDAKINTAYHILNQLESGDGPDIQIAWPNTRQDREWLSTTLYRCGVRLAKWQNGRLTAIEPTKEAMSGFIRLVQGQVTAHEQQRLTMLSGSGQVVRLFPRKLDATLLAGFDDVLPIDFVRVKTLNARYERHGESLKVTKIRFNDVAVTTSFDLLSDANRCY